jgi:SNF2 family DNA or RNA helicase
MTTVEIDPDRPQDVLIETNYQDRFLIKQLPGATWDAGRKVWKARTSWSTCVILRGLFKDRLVVGKTLGDWARQEMAERISEANRLRGLLKLEDDDQSEAAKVIRSWRGTTKFDLRPFQEAGVRYLYAAVSCGLTDPMGSGKTSQGISLLRLLRDLGEDPFPALIIAPNSVKTAWEREFQIWWPESAGGPKVQLVHGGAGARRKQLEEQADVYLINWEALRLHSRLAGYGSYALTDAEKTPKELNSIPWKVVIADEAHRAKDPKAKQTRALWALSRPATRRIFMTGTPIANRPDELWSPLNFMDPREWPSKTRYVEYFTNSQFNFWGGMEILGLNAETKDQFFKILDPRMRRIPKEVLLPQLPEKTYVQRDVEMTPKQAKTYKSMVEEALANISEDENVTQYLVGANPLVKNMRLMQLASAMIVGEEGNWALDEPSSKLDVLDEILEEMNGDQLVVFAQSKQLINLAALRLERRKIEHGLITGDISVPERQLAVDAFQSGKLQVMLATMAAGGTGITLTAAHTLVRLQRDWSAVNNSQAEDRIHRIGSERHDIITIIDLVAPNTVEMKQLDALAGKEGNLQEIVRDKQSLRRYLMGE